MFKRIWATKLTANDATPKEELGIVREEYDTTYGYRRFIYVQAAADTTVALGTALGFSDQKRQIVSSDTADFSLNQVAGVGIGTISAGYYGWIQQVGYHGGVKTDGGDDIADGETLVLSVADGVVDKVALGTASPYRPVGVAVADDNDDDDTVNAYLQIV